MKTYGWSWASALALSVSVLVSVSGLGCGDDDDGDGAGGGTADASATGDDGAPGIDASPAGIDAGVAGADLDMQASDFECILSGTKVRKFYLWNKLGKLDQALAVANDAEGGRYPVGTVIQLVPFEAMVKRAEGWNPSTNDWEFFFLEVNADGTTIAARGVEEVENQFGGNCFDCHVEAEPRWDLVCETGHGCDPLPIGDAIIESLQQNDARCP